MKIAVSSSGNNLDSQIDPRFGRCAYFVVVDMENMSFEAFDNESIALGGGAGIQAAQFVGSKGAKAILTGNVGPNAVKTLAAAGVEVFVGQMGTIREALERYKKGDLQSTSTPNVADHHGMGGGRGGRGMGRGMGGAPQGSGPSQAASMPKEEELKRLKEQVRELQEQIKAIE